ncbi:MAG: hypothetical protein ABII18_13480 [bacterium]
MKTRLKNQRGVALILVMAAISFLTVLCLDMFDDSLTGHQLAQNYHSRAQAYYLAKSGLNFSKMLLYYNKQVESTLAKKNTSLQALGYEPLYKMIPLSSELLRGMASMSQMAGGGDSEDMDDDSAAASDSEASADDSSMQSVGMLEKQDVEDFLNFDGNFDVLINEEQSKYSLNAVSKMTPTSSTYDIHKKVLLSLLQSPSFKNFFSNQSFDARNLVHAIADFVDSNTAINEFDQVERGSESSAYDGSVKYKVKNGPLLTLSELRLVAGMSDDILETLKPMVTVYHTSEKINICLAPEEVVDALIVLYTQYSECTNAMDAEKDAKDVAEIRTEILASCPATNDIATALYNKLGIITTSASTASTTTSPSASSSSSSSGSSSSAAATAAGCKVLFENLLSEDNNIFKIRATGTVNDVETSIEVVMDTSGSKASKWPIVYYHVD